jgi:CheY-like chemotaxis protein
MMMKTILQVEDDSNDVFFFQRSMKKAGVLNPIQVASDGQEAIDYLKGDGKFADREKYPLPGLVLLDLKLPYVMGLDVLKWIRQECDSTLVVVLLTASNEEADIDAAYRLGANGFLVKPSETSKLDDMVKAISHFWLTHNTLPPECHRQRPATSAYSMTATAKNLPASSGDRKEKWDPAISNPKYEPSRSLGL